MVDYFKRFFSTLSLDFLLKTIFLDILCLVIIFIFGVFSSIDLSFIVSALLVFSFLDVCIFSLYLIGGKNGN